MGKRLETQCHLNHWKMTLTLLQSHSGESLHRGSCRRTSQRQPCTPSSHDSKKVLKVVFFKLSNLDLPIKYLVFGYFKHININQLHPTQDLPPPAAPPNKTSVVVLSNRYSIACSCVCVKLASMFNSFDIYINLNRIIPRT